MKTTIKEVSIYRESGNPVFDCLTVGINNESAGNYLTITDNTDKGDGKHIDLDFCEFDAIVETVAKYRSEWNKNEM